MNKSALALIMGAALAATATFAAKSPASEKVVMTVGPEVVTLNEFEYLYKKNNEQQASKTTLDEYIDMFVNYKLKVAAAKDAGLDTAKSYLADMKKYTEELARPYLRDAAVDDSLVNVAYDHMKDMVEVSHILIQGMGPGIEPAKQKALADSIQAAIRNGADFAMAAQRHSVDRATADRGGYMGWIVGGVWPYTFEDLVYNTPVGEISKVAKSPYGYHIVRVAGRKPNPGQVKVRHILKETRGADEAVAELKHHQADSLYEILKGGADFIALAKTNTDEPQGQRTGGDLPWFSPGQMVAEFSDAAFAMQPGEISKPVKTSFGWHIILCEGRKPVAPIDSVSESIRERIKSDERSLIAIERTVDRHAAETGAHTEKAGHDAASAIIADGVLTEEVISRLKESSVPAATVNGRTVTVAEVAAQMRADKNVKGKEALGVYDQVAKNELNRMVLEDYIASLPKREPDYRNLLNEYRDGMLLYEASNNNVWDRANSDTEGLQRYYEAHKSDYTWDRPHYKGYIIAAVSDSIADEAVKYLEAAVKSDPEALTPQSVRKKFGNDVKVERVLAGKGDNAVVDNLCFEGPKAATTGRWKAYRTLQGRVIDQPEDARDVKGQVSLGYQQQLESEWLNELHKRYKVKVDRKALRKAFGER